MHGHVDSAKGFGRRLRETRLQAGMSQRQLSFTGCGPAYISRIEAGLRVPSLQMIHLLAERLNVSRDWLATGEMPTGDTEAALRQELQHMYGRIRKLERRLAKIHELSADPP